jgi:methionyl-tRNA formyltransferase
MKIIFFGTPMFAYTILKSLHEKHHVLAIVTQPDEKKGPISPVKQFALEHHIKLFQPTQVKTITKELMELQPELYITAAFGQFIPSILLNHRPSINVHASLLPLYRGAAPIQYAIKDGCEQTGITIMYMEKEMDAGNIIASKEVVIEKTDHATSLTEKLAYVGAHVLNETIPLFINGTPEGESQDRTRVTFAPKWTDKDEQLSLDMSQDTFINCVRANAMSPGATLKTETITMKIYEARKNDIIQPGVKGQIHLSKHALSLSLKEGVIEVLEIQIPGKKKLIIKDFLNGQKVFSEGMILKECI